MDEDRNAFDKRRRPWWRWTKRALLVLLALILIFHRPILFRVGRHYVDHYAAIEQSDGPVKAFLDAHVADLALRLPTRQKVRGFDKKRLLRKAVEPLLPREVVHGRKRGFSIPAAAWLRGELEPFARETLAPDVVRRQGYFRPEAVTRVLEDHVAGREDLSRQLWGLMSFMLWA